MQLLVNLLPGATMPTKANPGDAGWDLYPIDDWTLQPGERAIIPTGVRMAIPHGFYGRIAERSGHGAKGLAIGAGVIDSGYRGEIGIVVRNLRFFEDGETAGLAEPLFLPATKPIAQIIITRWHDFPIEEVSVLPSSERGERGFGSSDRG